ncbi:hypothetical protein [Haloparvum sp. PAK95]|uniref:hypothetical protein n=1 Tax=Haloparvum sp. PAK95 TaxID=3418962 RepID=UPI003D2F0787
MTNDPREHASADVAPELYATDGSGVSRTEADATDDETNAGDDAEPRTDHLDDVEEGAGCTEIWDHLSEKRAENAESESASEPEPDATQDEPDATVEN